MAIELNIAMEESVQELITMLSEMKDLWPSVKAGYLDATISSRAPASSALSTIDWTKTRAAALDKLTTGVSVVKSVQRGSYTGTGGTVTISPVTFGKALESSVSKGSAGYVAARGEFVERYASGGSGNSGSVSSRSDISEITGGTTDLTTKQFSAKLTSATTLYCDGPCDWRVVDPY